LVEVKLQNLTKKFGNITAVKDLNLEVKDGEFFVIVGPNGCGKTTILRLIAGVIKPNSGNIYIGGEMVNKVRPRDRGVRMVFQSFALYPHMKVYDEKSTQT